MIKPIKVRYYASTEIHLMSAKLNEVIKAVNTLDVDVVRIADEVLKIAKIASNPSKQAS